MNKTDMDKQLRPSVLKRAVALLIDYMVLGIFGFVLGLFFEDFFVSLGKYGTLVGTAIAIIYFSICQSKLGGGQSLGKMAISSKVTDLNGQYLSFNKSLLRAFILVFPIMNVELLASGKGMIVIMSLVSLLMLASIYLVIVNKSRRCLHDLLIPSVVINQSVSDFEIDERKDRSSLKLIPLGVLALLGLGMGFYQTFQSTNLSPLLAAKDKIEQEAGVIGVNKIQSSVTSHYMTDSPVNTYSSIEVLVRIDDMQEASDVDSKYFATFHDIIAEEVPEYKDVDLVLITLYYGYNIGIAHKTRHVTNRFTN